VPFLHWLAFRSVPVTRVLAVTLGQAALALTLLGLTLLHDGARQNLSAYLDQQLLRSVAGLREASSRLTVVKALLRELAPAVAAALLARWAVRARLGRPPTDERMRRAGWFFLLVGLSGSLPIMVSAKQHVYYVLPSLPFFALAIAAWSAADVDALVSRVGPRSVAGAAVALAAALAVALPRAGGIHREREIVLFVKQVVAAVPPGTTVNACASLDRNWTLVAYLARYGRVSVSSAAAASPFLLSDRACPEKGAEYPKLLAAGEALALHGR
jgi:hypothetical protein